MPSASSSGRRHSLVRDCIAMILLVLSGRRPILLLRLNRPAVTAGPATQVVEIWRAYGYLVFAGLFVLLAFWPRRYPSVWERAICHKVALTISAPTLIAGAVGAGTIVVADGLVAVFLIVSYVLAREYASWAILRTN
jgi:hypothetical protein